MNADLERAARAAKGQFTRRGYVWPRGPTPEDVVRAVLSAAFADPSEAMVEAASQVWWDTLEHRPNSPTWAELTNFKTEDGQPAQTETKVAMRAALIAVGQSITSD